jgi:methylmalonyl-CoA mutase
MSETFNFAEFPAASRRDWERRVLESLKGRTLEALKSTTEDGIDIGPLHEPALGEAIEMRSGGEAPSVIQRMDHPEPLAANALAQDDVLTGANGLALVFAGAPSARGFGLKSADARSIGLALKDLPLHGLTLRLEAGARGAEAAEALAEVIAARSLNPERMAVSFGMNPLGALASEGRSKQGWGEEARRVGDVAKALAREFTGPFVEADGRVYHDGGMSPAQELGATIATAVEYLRLLEGRLDDTKAAQAIGITLASDADMFVSLAKFRAARLLWRQTASSCGLPQAPLKLHAESSFRMMTRQEPQGNLLRNVAAVFAAGLGGADSICALPFSLALGLPDQFARRMARNVQSILIHESNLHRVEDAAAGSGYVDHLTTALAEKAWSFLQEIEGLSGIRAALDSGFIRETAIRAREARASDIKAGKRTIIGVTAYRQTESTAASILPVDREIFAALAGGLALHPMRDSEPFEADAAT